MGQQFGWWQLSSLHHRIATDIQVGKVRLAFKISLEAKLDVHTGGHGLSYGKKKSVFTSDFCHLFSGRRSQAAVAMESDLPLFFFFWLFLFIPHCFWMFETLRAGGLLFRNMFLSLSSPSPPPSMDEVYFSSNTGCGSHFPLAFGMIVGQLCQEFKMSNTQDCALAFVLWKERAWAGPLVPRRRTAWACGARWHQPGLTPSRAHIN